MTEPSEPLPSYVVRVDELEPGMYFEHEGARWTYVVQGPHPVFPPFRLVMWLVTNLAGRRAYRPSTLAPGSLVRLVCPPRWAREAWLARYVSGAGTPGQTRATARPDG